MIPCRNSEQTGKWDRDRMAAAWRASSSKLSWWGAEAGSNWRTLGDGGGHASESSPSQGWGLELFIHPLLSFPGSRLLQGPLIPWQVQSALCMGRVGRKSCQAKRCRCWDLEVQLMDQGDVGGILMCAKLLQPCPTFCYPMACSLPGSLSIGFSR